MKPRVSIITPSLNQGRFIEATILSVLSQDYPNIEYLVIDGGSTDETLSILKRYESRLWWTSERDQGQSDAINKGFRMATGEIIAWLNSDDTFLPDAISKAVDYLEAHPDVMMVYGEGYLMDESGKVTGRFPATEPFNLWRLVYYGDYILQQTVFMRKRALDEVGMLDESLHYGMDWDLWIRIGKRFKIAYVPEYLGNLREYPSAKSFSGGLVRFKELVSIMRRHGRRRFPPAYCNYGWQPYQEAVLSRISERFPWALKWTWMSRAGDFIRRVIAYVIFKKLTHFSHPNPYSDGWISDRAYFLLPSDGNKKSLHITGSTLHTPDRALPLELRVKVNGRLLPHKKRVRRVRFFEVTYPIPSQCQSSPALEVVLLASKHFIPSRDGVADCRRVSFQLWDIKLC